MWIQYSRGQEELAHDVHSDCHKITSWKLGWFETTTTIHEIKFKNMLKIKEKLKDDNTKWKRNETTLEYKDVNLRQRTA
jgi:hypothetical protein